MAKAMMSFGVLTLVLLIGLVAGQKDRVRLYKAVDNLFMQLEKEGLQPAEIKSILEGVGEEFKDKIPIGGLSVRQILELGNLSPPEDCRFDKLEELVRNHDAISNENPNNGQIVGKLTSDYIANFASACAEPDMVKQILDGGFSEAEKKTIDDFAKNYDVYIFERTWPQRIKLVTKVAERHRGCTRLANTLKVMSYLLYTPSQEAYLEQFKPIAIDTAAKCLVYESGAYQEDIRRARINIRRHPPNFMIPHEATPQEVTPQEVTTQEVTPQEIVPQEVAPQEATPQETTPQEIIPISKEIVPARVIPSRIFPKDQTRKL